MSGPIACDLCALVIGDAPAIVLVCGGSDQWMHEACYQERIVKPLTPEGALVELGRLLAQLRRRETIGAELLATLLLEKNAEHVHPRLREIARSEQKRWEEA